MEGEEKAAAGDGFKVGLPCGVIVVEGAVGPHVLGGAVPGALCVWMYVEMAMGFLRRFGVTRTLTLPPPPSTHIHAHTHRPALSLTYIQIHTYTRAYIHMCIYIHARTVSSCGGTNSGWPGWMKLQSLERQPEPFTQMRRHPCESEFVYVCVWGVGLGGYGRVRMDVRV